MKRKRLALVLAAIMAMSGISHTTMVSGAEFTDASALEMVDEEADTEGVFVSEEETVFTDEEAPEAQVDAPKTDEEYRAHYEGGYITREQFDHWAETGEEPEDWVQVGFYEELVTSDELFAKMKEEGIENTGYLMLSIAEPAEGFADLTVPEGTVLALAGGAGHNIQSIRADTGVTIRGNINTPGSLKLAEGTSVRLIDVDSNGIIEGTGRNTLEVKNWVRLGGIRGIDKFIYNTDHIEVRGLAEFRKIENHTGHGMGVFVEGYREDKIPVFYDNFDFGMEFDEEGNTWPAGIWIQYVEEFDVPEGAEWNFIKLEEGSCGIKFADSLSEKDVFEMRNRIEVSDGTVNMDGTVFYPGEQGENAFDVEFIKETDGMSAEMIFNNWGLDDIPDHCTDWIASSGNAADALRYVNLAEKYQNGQGYYKINLPWDAKITELSVPADVKGIIFDIKGDYNEATDEWKAHPSQVSRVVVPEGKIAKIMGICNTTEKLSVSGKGDAVFIDCRFSQQVNADTIISIRSTFKNLVCEKLLASQLTIITDWLEAGVIESDAVELLVKSGAVLDINTISKHAGNGPIEFWLEAGEGKIPTVHFTGEMKYEKEEYPEGATLWEIQYYDSKRAEAAGAPFVGDCFDINYDFWGGETGPWDFMAKMEDVKSSLLTISEDAADTDWNVVGFYFEDGNLRMPKNIAAGGKYNLVTFETGEETPVYVEVGNIVKSIADAEVSSIKTQIYQGKAVTPSVKVTYKGVTLKKDTDYTVSYKNNTKAGKTATVIIKGKGKYTGTISKNFKISAIPEKNKKAAIGNLKYKVTKSHYKSGEVSVYGALKKTGTGLSIPSTVKIAGYTFKVTRVESNAFKNWTKLKKATIGSAVKSIGQNAFYGCKALTSIQIKTSVLKTVEKNAFKGIHRKAVIKVPSKQLKAYQKLLKGKGQSSSVKITK